MSVSFEYCGEGIDKGKCFNTACNKNQDTIGHRCDNGCSFTSNTGKCKNFKGIKTEEPQIKYEIFKPFSIIDIYEKAPCSGEYASLLKENGSRDIDATWTEMRWIKKSPVLMRNLDWLEKNGFISEKKEEYMWINIYIDEDEDGGYYIGSGYHSEKNALEQTKTKNPEYVGTIQLKPKSAQ